MAAEGGALIVQGTVQRLVMSGVLPRTEHRTRDLSTLLSETEWGWSERACEAYVFAHYERGIVEATAYELSAESHAERVNAERAKGEPHAHACVHGSEAKALREISRAGRDAALDATVREMSVSPQESYERTRRYLGERD